MDTPHRIGPFRIVAIIGGEHDPALVRRFVGVAFDGAPVILTVPPVDFAEDTAYSFRFRAEGQKSRRLGGTGLLPTVDVASDKENLPWIAASFVSGLPLTRAVSVTGGPLPESMVCFMGRVLAETLAVAHSNGLVHAGLSPDSVLVTRGVPRVLDFGLRRVSDSHTTSTPPTVAEDILALGGVLAYAATGVNNALLGEIPRSLRPMIASCLTPTPSQRPSAAEVAAQMAGAAASAELPPAVIDELYKQECVVEEARVQEQSDSAAPTTVTSGRDSRIGPKRRDLLAGGMAGFLGLGLGGAGVWATGSFTVDRPSSPSRPRRFEGVAPRPLWQYTLQESAVDHSPLIVEDRVVVFTTKAGADGVSTRTGRRLWRHDGSGSQGPPVLLPDGRVLLVGGTLTAVSPSTGRTEWVEGSYGADHQPVVVSTVGLAEGVFFFITRSSKGGKRDTYAAVAYDTQSRRELWSTPLKQKPSKVGDSLLFSDYLVVMGTDGAYTALNSQTGEEQWTRTYRGVKGDGVTHVGTSDGLLVAAVESRLVAVKLDDATEAWSVTSEYGTFGPPVVSGNTIYVTDDYTFTYAVDVATGNRKWVQENSMGSTLAMKYPGTSVSGSGDTVLASNVVSVDAYEAKTGSPLWHFISVGQRGKYKGFAGRVASTGEGLALVQSDRVVYALPVD